MIEIETADGTRITIREKAAVQDAKPMKRLELNPYLKGILRGDERTNRHMERIGDLLEILYARLTETETPDEAPQFGQHTDGLSL